jgi:hypothetical protein
MKLWYETRFADRSAAKWAQGEAAMAKLPQYQMPLLPLAWATGPEGMAYCLLRRKILTQGTRH